MKRIHFSTIDSTNNYAKDLIGASESVHGTIITADNQISGRGRFKRQFSSNGGLYMSVILDNRNKSYPVTIAAAVAVRSVLASLFNIDVKIKWVNDLIFMNKKICGILTEAKLKDGIPEGFVCGIGINTKNTVLPSDLENIAGIINCEDKDSLAEAIAEKLIYMYENNINPIPLYKDGLILNVEVDVFRNDIFLFSGTAVDINENGNLIVKENGRTHVLNSGEISIRF